MSSMIALTDQRSYHLYRKDMICVKDLICFVALLLMNWGDR